MQLSLSDIPVGINQVEELLMWCFALINNFEQQQITLKFINPENGLAYDAPTLVAKQSNVIDTLNNGYVILQVALKQQPDRDIVPRYVWKQIKRIDEGAPVAFPNAYKNSQIT